MKQNVLVINDSKTGWLYVMVERLFGVTQIFFPIKILIEPHKNFLICKQDNMVTYVKMKQMNNEALTLHFQNTLKRLPYDADTALLYD